MDQPRCTPGCSKPGFGVFNDAANFSRLKAVDMETGKLKWKVGDRTQNAPVSAVRISPGGPGVPSADRPGTGRRFNRKPSRSSRP